jgi:asparagine synthase (glutamine-hydrolysing)
MCGISAIVGPGWSPPQLEAMTRSQRHRGPDAQGAYLDLSGSAGLGHNRLSIIDLSAAGEQPMPSADGRYWIAFNGEIYNYRELRHTLADYPYRSQTDTEVLLAAYARWGDACLDRLLGMFAFVIWDARQRRLFAARDRFGVKPLYYHQNSRGTLWIASEIKALHAAGLPAEPDPVSWATYLAHGLYDHSDRTFWRDVHALPAGHCLAWHDGRTRVARWYDLAERTGPDFDPRPAAVVAEEYLALMQDSVRLRFRADVPVGINLSGGLDSSALLGLVQAVQGVDSDVQAFTFTCGDAEYDETPWVTRMLAHTRHPWCECRLRPADVPALAESVQATQDEPFGGLPTLAYAKLFAEARAAGVIVLLDGQGMDEQWAGYDYYLPDAGGNEHAEAATVQGTRQRTTRPECLVPEFRALAETSQPPARYHDRLRNLQYRDTRYTKIPRALRFNDRVSMRSSTELREPFLDHRLFELAMRQPAGRKISGATRKWMLRQITGRLLPAEVAEAPKRPLQTPQREWLRGPLARWAEQCIEQAIAHCEGSWLDGRHVRREWQAFQRGRSDNSFYIWQWISVGLCMKSRALPHAAVRQGVSV